MVTNDHPGQKKIQCWINQDLWDKVEALNIPSQTFAVTQALELLVSESLKNPNSSPDIPGLRAQLEEKDRHIETLKGELDKAERDKEDLKKTYNNYFLQVQTLINQKAIDAPGTEKKKHWYKFW